MFTARQPLPRPMLRLTINPDRCLACGACVAVCPPNALFLHPRSLTVNPAGCTQCGRCASMCPVHALSLHPVETCAG